MDLQTACILLLYIVIATLLYVNEGNEAYAHLQGSPYHFSMRLSTTLYAAVTCVVFYSKVSLRREKD